MPVSVNWGNEAKTFVVFEFLGNWTWDEYYQGRKRGIALGNGVPHVVNLLVDYSQSSMFPRNMLSHFGSSMDHNPKEFDLAVIVTESAFAIAMLNMLSKLRKKSKFRVAKTRVQAETILEDFEAQQKADRVIPVP
jgi:hypothetical protein